MTVVHNYYTAISSITEIELENEEEKSKNEEKILAFDFDHTLAISEYVCTTDLFNDYMVYHNAKDNNDVKVHDLLLHKLREQTSFTSCEYPKKVENFINKAKKLGWKVIILTARPDTMLEITKRNIREAKLPEFKDKNIIFSLGDKKKSLLDWIDGNQKLHNIKKFKVSFVDDKIYHCNVMNSLNNEDTKKEYDIQVKCYHFQKFLIDYKMDDIQKRMLLVQLSAYNNERRIPKDFEITEEMEELAIKEFNLVKEDLESGMYKTILKIATTLNNLSK